jgi:DNA-binding MarR family transcriptional regulator
LDERDQLIQQIVGDSHHLYHLIRSRASNGWLDANLTMPQAKALLCLYSADGMAMKHLAEKLGVSVTSITGLVDRLVDQGLVHRDQDAGDRRLVIARLTVEGRAALERLQEIRQGWMARVFSRMSTEQLKIVAQGFDYTHGAIRAEMDSEEAHTSADKASRSLGDAAI